jgi:hypothetical protein
MRCSYERHASGGGVKAMFTFLLEEARKGVEGDTCGVGNILAECLWLGETLFRHSGSAFSIFMRVII